MGVATSKGVIVEFDFAAMDGAELLFDVVASHLRALDGIALDQAAERKFLAGRTYVDGLAAFFRTVKTKKTPQKTARDIAAAFSNAVAGALPKAVTPGLRKFTAALVERGAKVVFLTHAAPDAASAALAPLLGENVSVFQDETDCYGFPRWDAWRRASHANRLPRLSAVAVTGSGFGVRSALLAGMGSMAVVKQRTSYQDFTGADDIVKDISAATARRLLARLFKQA